MFLDTRDMEHTIEGITKKLNDTYYNLESDSFSNMYIVGSVGRKTAIKNCSDLDLLFNMPKEIYKKYDDYDSNGQSALLQDVKKVLKTRYPKTDIRGDGQVIILEFTNYTIELVPGFLQKDNKFIYPDTNDGGSWKYTDPINEQKACKLAEKKSKGIFCDFCHLIRAWKNQAGFSFKGLLIDSLVYVYLNDNKFLNDCDYSNYLDILIGLLQFLGNQDPKRKYWYSLGSNQKVYNKDGAIFVSKAKEALKVLDTSQDKNRALKKLFGGDYPLDECYHKKYTFDNTEEFAENKFKIDIRYNLKIDAIVIINGFKEYNISEVIRKLSFIRIKRKIRFYVICTDCPKPYSIYWKVRNVGEIAEKRNMIRGQIVKGNDTHVEPTSFAGPHFVECYIIKNGVCVAKDRIDVPIKE